jgi:hypothetical protein
LDVRDRPITDTRPGAWLRNLGHDLRDRLTALHAGLSVLQASDSLRPEIVEQLLRQIDEALLWSQDLFALMGAWSGEGRIATGVAEIEPAVRAAVGHTECGRRARRQTLEIGALPPGVEVTLSAETLERVAGCLLVAASVRAGPCAPLEIDVTTDPDLALRIRSPGWPRTGPRGARSLILRAIEGAVAPAGARLERTDGGLALYLPRAGPNARSRGGRSSPAESVTAMTAGAREGLHSKHTATAANAEPDSETGRPRERAATDSHLPG